MCTDSKTNMHVLINASSIAILPVTFTYSFTRNGLIKKSTCIPTSVIVACTVIRVIVLILCERVGMCVGGFLRGYLSHASVKL